MPPPPQPASSTRPRIATPGALEKRDDLRAPVVLEQRVVVFGAEPQVGVRLDGALVNRAHARPVVDGGRASPNLSIRAARSWPEAVSATSKVMMIRDPDTRRAHPE